jgi:hypothetical protein
VASATTAGSAKSIPTSRGRMTTAAAGVPCENPAGDFSIIATGPDLPELSPRTRCFLHPLPASAYLGDNAASRRNGPRRCSGACGSYEREGDRAVCLVSPVKVMGAVGALEKAWARARQGADDLGSIRKRVGRTAWHVRQGHQIKWLTQRNLPFYAGPAPGATAACGTYILHRSN